MSAVRGLTLGVLMILSIAAVLVLAARNLSKERDRLLQDFAGAEQAIAHDLAASLEDRLLDTEEDARVIATLVHAAHTGSRSGTDGAEANMLASFNAMATVVRHYRSLALFRSDGRSALSAVDPSEPSAVGDALLRASRAEIALASGSPRLSGPIEIMASRFIYLYSFVVDGDVVVIAIDAPRFVQSALRSIPGARTVVVDPAGMEWHGCAPGIACAPRSGRGQSDPVDHPITKQGIAWLDAPAAAKRGLPNAAAVAAWTTVGPKHLGQWRVLLVASALALQEREQALVRQLALSVIGLLAAISLVGVLIVRQQRYSAALSERLRNAETLRSLEGQLIRAEKIATTGVLAAGIAHEVGTPLGIIRGRAELLLEELGPHASRPGLDAIVQQIDRISSTIRQVLDFSRSQPVEVTPVAPGPALQAVIELLEHRFKQQRLKVTTAIVPEVPPIAADPNQLQQVLVNLLLNACDACPTGGALSLSVTPAREGSFVILEIRDNGKGIAQEDLLAVFDPFFTTKKRGEGTGLGLPVATAIVRNHGGEISLASTVGWGTTVTIRWPVFKEGCHGQG